MRKGRKKDGDEGGMGDAGGKADLRVAAAGSGRSLPDLAGAAGAEWWDPKKEKLLELLFAGTSKTRAAKELGVHKETAIIWSRHPEFAKRLGERLGDHAFETRVRRVRQTTHFGDKAAAHLERAMRKLDVNPSDADARILARTWADEFRTWREEERKEFGENVARSQVLIGGAVQVGVTSTREVAFRGFLSEKIDEGVVDVEALPSDDPGLAVASALAQILAASPEVNDQINEEDRANDPIYQKKERAAK